MYMKLQLYEMVAHCHVVRQGQRSCLIACINTPPPEYNYSQFKLNVGTLPLQLVATMVTKNSTALHYDET